MDRKTQLHRLVEQLNEQQAEEVLDYASWVLADDVALSVEDTIRIVVADAELASREAGPENHAWRREDV
jgi:hypothetical protein